jgi:hypothetical protein
MNELREPSSGPIRLWSIVLVAAGLLLAWLGGARENFRPEPSGAVPVDTPIPVALEPQGELPEPPKVFRWTPGGTDVDVSQVAIYRSTLEPLWQSRPTHATSLELDPSQVFHGIPAGEELAWRVREVSRGRPRATSAFVKFKFQKNAEGLPVGARPNVVRPLQD